MQWKSGSAIAAMVFIATVANAAAAETIKITIKGFKFSPAAVTAHVGDKIEWTNNDAMPHTSTAKSGEWDLPVPAGKSATLLLKTKGAFDYFCKIHPSMTAKLTVE
jgi:plastocyanin